MIITWDGILWGNHEKIKREQHINFKISSRIVQGEHKFLSWLQTFITRKIHVAPQLEEFQPWIIFQQDGAPPHWGSHVRRFWMQDFQTGGLGEMVRHTLATTIAGYHPPPLDFFLCGYVKDKVFSTPVPDITNLKARITDAFVTVTEDMLENTWRETDYRLDVLRAKKGAHAEVYWCVVKKNFLSYILKQKYMFVFHVQ